MTAHCRAEVSMPLSSYNTHELTRNVTLHILSYITGCCGTTKLTFVYIKFVASFMMVIDKFL